MIHHPFRGQDLTAYRYGRATPATIITVYDVLCQLISYKISENFFLTNASTCAILFLNKIFRRFPMLSHNAIIIINSITIIGSAVLRCAG